MGLFLNWNEWKLYREDNARKRRIRATLKGQEPPLPGSYAANPSTNPQAMDVASRTGVVKKNLKFRFKEDNDAKPNYSFDRWVQKAKEFGDDVNQMVGHAQEDEKKLDKDTEQSKKKADDEDTKSKVESPELGSEDEPKDEKTKKKDEVWQQLRQIHQDRLKDQKSPIADKKGSRS